METHFAFVALDRIRRNPLNPRTYFDKDGISELAESLKSSGMLQPLIVYRKRTNYVLVCGERRYRAARSIGMDNVPAIVHPKPLPDQTVVSLALIENLQRRDVDVLSEASAMRRLTDDHGWSQRKLADDLGVSIPYVRNRLLLTQHADVLESYSDGALTLGQAAILGSIEDAGSRSRLLQRTVAAEFEGVDELSEAVRRDQAMRELATTMDGWRLLRHDLVRFNVSGLPRCNPSCQHYMRLSWDEKRRHCIDMESPGWTEICKETGGTCFQQKVQARQDALRRLRAIASSRSLFAHADEQVLWFRYRGKTCRQCEHLLDASEIFTDAEREKEPDGCFCSRANPKCFESRLKAFSKAQIARRRKAAVLRSEEKDELILQAATGVKRGLRTGLTKRECVYLLMQYLCYAGGEERLARFAERNGWSRSLPVAYQSRISYVRNKLLDEVPESDILGLLFAEAAASAAYSRQSITPLRFDPATQSETTMRI